MKTKIFLLGAVILSVGLIFIAYDYFKQGTIHIAFAGPSEKDAAGKLMIQAIGLYFDKINRKGGINGQKIVLEKFDDQNDANTARLKALEIAEQNEVLAVIGHWYSDASISAGKIYEDKGIPAITPGSANINVTKGNKWYFRNIYNATESGQFLAHYVKNVFKQEHVSIINERAAYGSYLAKVFEKESQKLNMTVKKRWEYDDNNEHLDDQFVKIVNELNFIKNHAGIIFLAVKATEGVKLVKLIKDAGIQNVIIGADSLSEDTFRNGFDKFPISKDHPGFYTNDIYVATPLLFDTANEKAQQFKEEYKDKDDEIPDWSAAYAYDTAMVLVEAIKRAEIQGTSDTLQADRQKIRDTLANFTNIYDAVEGATGPNYFDHNRDAQKPVSIGVYKHKALVSALTQLQVVRNPNEISDLKKARQAEQVLFFNGKYMYKTNVVYVGLKFIEISDIDIKNLQFTLDFKLWFRFLGKFDPSEIEFINAIDSKEIYQQLKNSMEKKDKGKIQYHVYRIKGRFRADFLPDYYAYKQHIVGVSFRHRILTRNNLIYVTDEVGMGTLETETPLLERLIKKRVLNPKENWFMNRVWFFPNTVKEYSAGDPDYINVPQGKVEYSQFNAAIQIKKDQITPRGWIPYEYANHLIIFSGLTFILLMMVSNKQKFSKLIWFFQVIFAILLLLSAEIRFAQWLNENTTVFQMKYIIKIFDILWWLIPAFLIHIAAGRFLWPPLEEKIGALPNIIRHFFALLIYFFALIGIIVFVYEQQFTSLLAASGMIAMIVGLAIQINISNVFSGIVINMERPFRLGDWIKIGQFDEGEVIDINWRATRLLGRNGCMLSIPNSIAAEAPIVNFHYPTQMYWLWPTVYVHPRYSPIQIKKILLDALLSSNQVIKEPAPVVLFTGINEWAASYWIAFCADSYANKYFILEEVWTRVWFHLSHADIAPAVMRQEIHVFKGRKSVEPSNNTLTTQLPLKPSPPEGR
jgi:potassium-dependent mechanosensitive channel